MKDGLRTCDKSQSRNKRWMRNREEKVELWSNKDGASDGQRAGRHLCFTPQIDTTASAAEWQPVDMQAEGKRWVALADTLAPGGTAGKRTAG